MKQCSKCGECKPLGAFYTTTHNAAGRMPACKDCVRAKNKEWRTRNRGKMVAMRREKHLKAKYGISTEGYIRMLEAQSGRCAICGTKKPGGKGCFHIDHDHRCCPGPSTCGKCVRGLLCMRCNSTLNDNPAWHRAAIKYLIG